MYPIHVLAAILAVTGTGMALPLEDSIAVVTSSPTAPVVEQPKESWAGYDDPNCPEVASKRTHKPPKKILLFPPKGPMRRDGMEKRDLAMDTTWVVDEDGFRTLSPESIAAIFDAAPGPVVPESTPDAAASAATEKDAGDKILLPEAIEKINRLHGPGVVAPPANTTAPRKTVFRPVTKVPKKTKKPATTSPATATATGNSTATATGTPTAADSSATKTPPEELRCGFDEIRMVRAILTACDIPTNKTNAHLSPLEQIWSIFWKTFQFRPWAISTKEEATQNCLIKAYSTWLRKMGTVEPTATPENITEKNASPFAIACLPEFFKAVQERRDNGMVNPATGIALGGCIKEAHGAWMEHLRRLSQKPAAEPTTTPEPSQTAYSLPAMMIE